MFAHVLEIHQLRASLEFGFELLKLADVDEAVCGDDALHLRGTERGLEARGAGREIEHRRHAAIRRDREEGDDGRSTCRQHDADGFAPPGAFLECAAERQRGADEFVIGEDPLVAVHHGDLLSAKPAAGLRKGGENGLLGPVDVERHDLLRRTRRQAWPVSNLWRSLSSAGLDEMVSCPLVLLIAPSLTEPRSRGNGASDRSR